MSQIQDIARECIRTITQGGVVLCPTSTVWGLSCDATNPEAFHKILDIKESGPKQGSVILALEAWLPTLSDCKVELPQIDTPTTFIIPAGKNVAPDLLGDDGSIALRFDGHPFIKALLSAFGGPLVSTSANLHGEPTPGSFSRIRTEIREGCDLVVDSQLEGMITGKASRLVKILDDGGQIVLRE